MPASPHPIPMNYQIQTNLVLCLRPDTDTDLSQNQTFWINTTCNFCIFFFFLLRLAAASLVQDMLCFQLHFLCAEGAGWEAGCGVSKRQRRLFLRQFDRPLPGHLRRLCGCRLARPRAAWQPVKVTDSRVEAVGSWSEAKKLELTDWKWKCECKCCFILFFFKGLQLFWQRVYQYLCLS